MSPLLRTESQAPGWHGVACREQGTKSLFRVVPLVRMVGGPAQRDFLTRQGHRALAEQTPELVVGRSARGSGPAHSFIWHQISSFTINRYRRGIFSFDWEARRADPDRPAALPCRRVQQR